MSGCGKNNSDCTNWRESSGNKGKQNRGFSLSINKDSLTE